MKAQGDTLVAHDTYDARAFERAFRGDDAVLDRARRLLPRPEALLQDLWSAFFKLRVVVLPRSKTPPGAALARRALLAVLEDETFPRLKVHTALDETASARAAAAVLERLVDRLARGDLVDAETLLTAQAVTEADRSAGDLDALADTLDELGESERAEAVRREAIARRDDAAQEARALDEAVDAVPPAFDTALGRRVEDLAEAGEEGDRHLTEWARSVGGDASRLPAGARLDLAERLRKQERLQKLARLVGALREAARAARRKRFERAAAEVHRVGRGSDLARLLPVERALLAHPVTRREVHRRLIEGTLFTYALIGDDRRGRGPLVVCVDSSGSMAGPKELWAKGVAIALVEIARRQGRALRVIVFSGPEAPRRHFDLLGRRRRGAPRVEPDLVAMADLAEHAPAGGTDFEGPLGDAARALESRALSRGDIVFITDGEARVSPAFAAALDASKKRLDFRVLGVLVDIDPGGRVGEGLQGVADEVTTVSRLTSEGAGDLFVRL